MVWHIDPKDIPEEYASLGIIFEDYDDSMDEREDNMDDVYDEKELARLYKVASGLHNKKERMLFVNGVSGDGISSVSRDNAMAKLERTKAWRGLMFDIAYVDNEIKAIEEYLKRERG